jgi:hypothetical protein
MTTALALLYGAFVGIFSAFFAVTESVRNRLDHDLREIEAVGRDIEKTAKALGLDYQRAGAIFDLAGRLQHRTEGADPEAFGPTRAMRLAGGLFAALFVGASFVLPELSSRLVVVGVVGGFAATTASYGLTRAGALARASAPARRSNRVAKGIRLLWVLLRRKCGFPAPDHALRLHIDT